MGSINLNKQNAGVGNGATLFVDDAETIPTTKIRFGASWDTSSRGKSGILGRLSKKGGLDIDLIAVLMQGTKPVKYVGLDNLNPLGDGTIVHSGDNQTGQGDGDDEIIDVDLTRMPISYTSVIFLASVFKGEKSGMFGSMASAIGDKGFQGASNVEFRMYNTSTPGTVIEDATIMPSLLGTENTCLIAKVGRTSEVDPSAPWQIEVLEEMVVTRKDDMPSLLRACLDR